MSENKLFFNEMERSENKDFGGEIDKSEKKISVVG